ncbi:cytochrome P450 [Dactylosporangium sp. CA-139114]|uniref:cytochrome P450 n=1 Tax=Dactylosporangium sp. CA-139114 TaxID=3239931 RepID=UPI003D959B4C
MTARWERRIQLAAHPLTYPLARALARLGPVVRVPGLGVVVNDAATARAVLTDTDTFSKAAPGSPADLWTPVLGRSVLLNMAGPDHARLRRQLSGLFTPAAVRGLCERVLAATLTGMTRRLAGGEGVDVVTEVRRCAGAVIAELVGLPAREARDAARFDEMFARGTEVTSMVRLTRRGLTPRQVVRARTVMAELTAPAVAAYRAADASTVPGRMRELGLTEDEARGAVAAFVLTGTETLVSFVPRLVALGIDSGWLARLTDDPSRSDAVVADALRYTVPSPVMLRGVTVAGRVGPVAVAPGDRVVIMTLSCARAYGPFDPERPHPAELRRLWFGAGAHFCLGMPLALAEIHAFLDAILDAWRQAGPLVIRERRAAARVLIPGYARLVLGRPS